MMIAEGLEAEARRLYPLRHLNALDTVGYKEMFGYFDGEYPLEEAVRLIQRNTRHYAKKQLTWFKHDTEMAWFHPDQREEIMAHIRKEVDKNKISQ